MTEERLVKLERLCGEASPGPWKAFHDRGETDPELPPSPGWCVSPNIEALGHRDYRVVCRTCRMAKVDEPADAAFIAAAREAVPELISSVRRLRLLTVPAAAYSLLLTQFGELCEGRDALKHKVRALEARGTALSAVLRQCRVLVEHELMYRPDEAPRSGRALLADIDELLKESP